MTEFDPNPEKEISPEVLSEKVSLLLLKPENSGKEVIFPAILHNYNLKTQKFNVTLTEGVLNDLYPDIQTWAPEVQQATMDHLLNQEVVVFLVSQEHDSGTDTNVLEQVLKLRGTETNPSKNDSSTLRAVFYGQQHNLDESGKTYWENGIHCPRNTEELMSNLKALNLYDQAKNLALEKVS